MERHSASLIIREMQIRTTVWCHLTPVKVAIVRKSTNNKRSRGHGGKGTFLHCWWECKLVQPLWKTVWRFLKKLKNTLAIWSSRSSVVAQLVKNPSANAGDIRDASSIPESGRSPGGGQPTPVSLPGESHGQRCQVGYNRWGQKSQTGLRQLSIAYNLNHFAVQWKLTPYYKSAIPQKKKGIFYKYNFIKF